MVVRDPHATQDDPGDAGATDAVFHALADPTRRDILGRTLVREHSVSELAELYPMSFAAVQKHVAVLERADLVTKRAQHRHRFVRGNPRRLASARHTLDRLEGEWVERLDRFEDALRDDDGTGGGDGRLG